MQKFKATSFFPFILGSNVSAEKKIDRKVKPKSPKSTGKKPAKTTKTATEPKASKYFQSPVKKEEEEEEHDSEDDFDISTVGAPALAPKMEKDEEEEDSDEDEGDWEEVEGLSAGVGFVKGKGVTMTTFQWPK